MKKVLLFSLVLLAASGVLLMNQWIGFEKMSGASDVERLTQTIELDIQPHVTKVNHLISGFGSESVFSFKLPAEAENVSCSKDDSCEAAGQSGKATVEGETMSVRYELPPLSFQSAFLLPNWYMTIDDNEVVETSLFVSDHGKHGGGWVVPLDHVATENLSQITFYSFSGETEEVPLYWQPFSIKKQTKGPVSVYADQAVDLAAVTLPFSDEDAAHYAVVVTSRIQPETAPGLLVIQSADQLRNVRTALIQDYVQRHFLFPEEEEWLESFIGVSLYGAQPLYMKASDMKAAIESALTAEQYEQWLTLLRSQKGKSMSAEQLDQWLSEAKQEETEYFSENRIVQDPLTRLSFFDKRPVFVEGTEAPFRIKKKDGFLYIPLQESGASLGYAITQSASQIALRKGAETFLFELANNRVLVNGRPFTWYEGAVQQMDGKLYIDKIWFQKLFLIEVQEQADKIALVPYGI